jgi:hypothetical protein
MYGKITVKFNFFSNSKTEFSIHNQYDETGRICDRHEELKNAQKISVGYPEGKRSLGKSMIDG